MLFHCHHLYASRDLRKLHRSFFASFFPEYRPGVVDMIIFTPLDTLWEKIIGSSFPIFNVADVCLVIGVIFLVIDILFFQERRAVK